MTKSRNRRAKGTGSVYRDARKGWVGQVTIDGRRHKVYGRTKTETQTNLNQVLAQAVTGMISADKTLTVAALLDRFLTRSLHHRRRGTLAPATKQVHEWAAARALPLIGKRRVSDLTRSQVETMLDKLAAEGLSRSSLRRVLLTLQLALDTAVDDGTCLRNVARAAELPGDVAAGRQRGSLSPADALRLAEQLPSQPLGAMFLLMLRCGLRPGEAAAIHWDDLTGDVLNIRHGLRRDGGSIEVVRQLKTASSQRQLRLPPEVVRAIADHRRQQTRERLAAPFWTHPELMFTSSVGGVLDPSNTRKIWNKICRDLDLKVKDSDRRPSPNELRHSCASMLAYLGTPYEQIAALLGHTTTRMIEQTYGHRLTDAIETAATQWTVRRR